mmetsp:Transcript_11109/g.41492  ORF Transcript_11109/g.41492 Transcript_11109/m.41492 type:complete len:156 (+) Transcript_11109:50-517(+)
MTLTSHFKSSQFPNFTARKNMSLSIVKKHPNHIPLIIQFGQTKSRFSTSQPLIFKLIIQSELTAGEVLGLVRSKLKDVDEQEKSALLMRFGISADDGDDDHNDKKGNESVIAIGSMNIAVLYEKYRDADGFLYGWVTKENVFGCDVDASSLAMLI